MITLIAAIAENRVLGKDNAIIWHLPDDFKHFKTLTSHHYIIMGRKTFESFPKPLPNRTHVIITRQQDYAVPENCIVVHSLREALTLTQNEEEVFVIGGGEIYHQALEHADQLELTQIHASFDGDAFFPEFSTTEWQLVKESYHPQDERHAYAFTFQTYIRK
ncbi:dihydrofolate reductase [Myroides sp. 1354]|uniref:dihydrofolate reductase n=1 Tax=unclassified Myroides TaxID=2642485 RepID=UPI002578A64F|nr:MULTISPECIES: dihydrofolate reductase [unclassified Myroides]MDM1044156.1 dihydrofolate reductase [Myroides sp. R163-1]MDM1055092.1 dihydrofolate reductase [Myroides sp. 1354]MDM1068389.1 dihydrofolate reductase [Myroides sp. 1372]